MNKQVHRLDAPNRCHAGVRVCGIPFWQLVPSLSVIQSSGDVSRVNRRRRSGVGFQCLRVVTERFGEDGDRRGLSELVECAEAGF